MAGLKGSLQLRQTQSQTLAMTPQLQAAIKLLQLSTLELQQEIEQAIEANPLLEIDEKQTSRREESLESLMEDQDRSGDGEGFDLFDNDSSVQANYIDGEDSRRRIEDNPEIKTELSHQDIAPDDYSAGTRGKNRALAVDDDSVYEGETSETIQDHLFWQLDLSPLTGTDRLIAKTIIDAVDDSGYLTESIESIHETVMSYQSEATLEEVATVLKLVQHYDPVGIAARSVQECLQIQLEALAEDTPYRAMALNTVKNHFRLLSNRDFRSLCQRLSIKEDELKNVMDLILSLNPRPGHFVVREKSDFVIPDVLVSKRSDGSYDVQLNPDSVPSVRLNQKYLSLASRAQNERDRQFFKNNLNDANFFLSSLQKRNDTLLKVSRCIVAHQKDFMDQGESGMHPMILNDIATEVEMHESTISRVTTEKYIHTPRGTYELKYFFSSAIGTDSGEATSSMAIRAKIKEIVATENPRRPFSDSYIAEALQKDGINVARRTIAKYREGLGIPSSSQRKRLV